MLRQFFVFTLTSSFVYSWLRLNFVTIITNINSAIDYKPIVEVALSDLEKKYPSVMTNYTWSSYANLSKKFFICTPEDFDSVTQAMMELYHKNKLTANGALTIVYTPSRSFFLTHSKCRLRTPNFNKLPWQNLKLS